MVEEEFHAELARVQEVKEANQEALLDRANVLGVGIGHKEAKGKEKPDEGLCVQVYVREKVAKTALAADDFVPATVGEVVTDVREVGDVVAQPYTGKIRPARPGYSVGHFRITAGTFGCLVRDVCAPCRVHILSNNHVLADSNAASIGDPILQPGRHDGGVIPADVIARLSRFVPMHFNSPDRFNLVDAALAVPEDLRNVIASIVALGIPKGVTEATLGLEVVKSGRTTQTTGGKVTGIDATIAVGYGGGRVGYFRDQILTTNMSAGGDSGSLLLSRADRKATGLLFAGSEKVTVHNNITNVLSALGVELITA